MSLREKLGMFSAGIFALYWVQWVITAILVAAPLASRHADAFVTLLCHNMAQSWAATWIFSIGLLLFLFQLYGNYRQAHAPEFDMEPMLDSEKASLKPGQDGRWIDTFRSAYRRRQFVSLVTSTLIVSTFVMYYEVYLLYSVIVRRHLVVMKGTCGGQTLSFGFLEKTFLTQFLNDLPFSMGSLWDVYGKCSPDSDEFAMKLLTTLANSLHWFIILLVVGFLWGKQIKTWFFPPAQTAA